MRSITNKATDGPSLKASFRGADLIVARGLLLQSPEMRSALLSLARQRAIAFGPDSTPRLRGGYWQSVTSLAGRTDDLYDAGKLDHLASNWARNVRLLDAGCDWELVLGGVGISGSTSLTLRVSPGGDAELVEEPSSEGPRRRAKRLAPSTTELAVRSIALQVAGHKPTHADREVADELNVGRRPQYLIRAEHLAVYRQRLRDRATSL